MVMYAVGVCAKGVTDLYFASAATEIDCFFIIHSTLKSIVVRYISRLYPEEEHKVVLHVDSVGSHTTPKVYAGSMNKMSVPSERRMTEQLSTSEFHGLWPKGNFFIKFCLGRKH
jgi:hypothetical protein